MIVIVVVILLLIVPIDSFISSRCSPISISRIKVTNKTPTSPNSSPTTSLYMKQWYEDDLPNILGINPLEAAVIFGALYYFYGPTVLYEYAREAGRFVSTYTPIIRDTTTNIFNEFKDYFDEDQDRERMRKAGIDVDKLPRSTTNIIERFQVGFKAITADTSSASSNDDDIGNDSDSTSSSSSKIIDNSDKLTNDNKRRSKKEVYEARNIDIDKFTR